MKKVSQAVGMAIVLFGTSAPALALDEQDHPPLSGALEAFHDVLRVDWHADKGPERNVATCRNAGHYIVLARDIAHEDASDPAHAEHWSEAADGLVDASVALSAYCASGNAANVEAGLSTLHDRFHDIMKLAKAPK